MGKEFDHPYRPPTENPNPEEKTVLGKTLGEPQLQILETQERNAPNVVLYLDLLDLVNDVSKKRGESRRQRKALRVGLAELYFAKGNHQELRKFSEKWGKGKGAREIFDIFVQDVEEPSRTLRIRYIDNPTNYRVKERLGIGLRAGGKLAKGTTFEQKAKLLNLAGYPTKDAFDFAKKMGTSLVLSTLLGAVYWTVSLGSFGELLANPVFKTAKDEEALVLLGLSYLVNYGCSLVNSIQNVRLLRNRHIENSPNIAATSTFYVLDKLLPPGRKRKLIRDGTTAVVSTATSAWKEPGTIALVLSSDRGLSAVTMSYFVIGGFNLLQATGAEAFLRIRGKERKKR